MNKKTIIVGIFFTMCLIAIAIVIRHVGALNLKQEELSVDGELSLYPRSSNAWVGDVMPLGTDESLELYYLYDTDHNGSGYHPIHKFSTKNFYSYVDGGCAIEFGESGSLDRAIGTGSVFIAKDGKWHCFYTGHNDQPDLHDGVRECVMHAVSDDGENWTKIPEDTFFASPNYSNEDFRDPFVFWNEEAGCYWLIIAAREDKLGGVVARYSSSDLKEWTLMEPLFAPQKQYMLECPDLFKMGDKYYLFYSWDCVTYYAMSDSINGPFIAPADNILDGTGFSFYAAKTAEYKGNRYLCGWVGRKQEKKDSGNYDWAGNLVIHQLVQKADGSLGVKAPDGIKDYLRNKKKISETELYKNVQKSKNGYVLSPDKKDYALINLGQREPVMSLEFDVTFEEDGCAGVGYGTGDKYDKYTALVLDKEHSAVHYEGSVLSRLAYVDPHISTAFNFEAGEKYHVKLVIENEIVITYVNDTKALSTRVYKLEEDSNLVLYAYGAECKIENVEIMTP